MRVLLVGSPDDCIRLRTDLDESVEIAGEFDSVSAARASQIAVDAYVLAPGARHDDEPVFEEAITPRENEVLELLALGLTNKAIAGRLGISDQTVKFHVASLLGKLGAHNRTDAVRRAARRGVITL